MKDICVIGAGVAGLVAARYLQEKFCVTIYEASSSIGGIWLYNKHMTGVKHTPMYKNLRTNLPKQLMTFRDLPYDQDIPTFLTHGQVMDYLDRYCQKFSISSLIKFDTPVISVKPELSSDPVKWIVSTTKGKNKYLLLWSVL
jgi:cation diffusion facilitator CzcD-associated flavoprotein CzcO